MNVFNEYVFKTQFELFYSNTQLFEHNTQFNYCYLSRILSYYLVYKLYRRRTPFEYFGGDQATVNDCADDTAIFMFSGGPGARMV